MRRTDLPPPAVGGNSNNRLKSRCPPGGTPARPRGTVPPRPARGMAGACHRWPGPRLPEAVPPRPRARGLTRILVGRVGRQVIFSRRQLGAGPLLGFGFDLVGRVVRQDRCLSSCVNFPCFNGLACPFPHFDPAHDFRPAAVCRRP